MQKHKDIHGVTQVVLLDLQAKEPITAIVVEIVYQLRDPAANQWFLATHEVLRLFLAASCIWFERKSKLSSTYRHYCAGNASVSHKVNKSVCIRD